MNQTERDVVFLSLAESLQQRGSWCGETHLQKATFFFQELLRVPLGFDFVLYKHGPYSFDLKDELNAYLADGLLTVIPRPPFGPGLSLGENGKTLLGRFPKTRERFRAPIDFVASRLGSAGIAALERFATALFVTSRAMPQGSAEERAARINELKPHIPLDIAHDAVAEVDKLIAEARSSVYSSG